MEKFDDVSNMTYLNEASVLWNLKSRYVAKLIYVRYLSIMTKSNKVNFSSDLLWFVLCCRQPLQEVSNLYANSC